MGVFMGGKFRKDVVNHEDLEFFSADKAKMKRLCQRRHAQYDRWGWKDATLLNRWAEVRHLVPDLEPVYVLRDPWAVAQSEVRHAGKRIDHAFLNARARLELIYADMARYRTSRGTMDGAHALSFERLRWEPESELERLAEFIGAEVTEDMIEFVTSDGYRDIL